MRHQCVQVDNHVRNRNTLEEGTNYTQTGKRSGDKSLTEDAVIKHYRIF